MLAPHWQVIDYAHIAFLAIVLHTHIFLNADIGGSALIGDDRLYAVESRWLTFALSVTGEGALIILLAGRPDEA